MKHYSIKEIFYSVAGEGYHTGRPALFVRFSGCNLWSGLEKDREEATCKFCDTQFLGTDGQNGGKYAVDELMLKLKSFEHWRSAEKPFLVFTGGEPSLQLDEHLIEACHRESYEVAIETNGTRPIPQGIDWICVSPKSGSDWIIQKGDELKVVLPQDGLELDSLLKSEFSHYYLQPDWRKGDKWFREVAEYCLTHPKWKLSPQVHKFLGLS